MTDLSQQGNRQVAAARVRMSLLQRELAEKVGITQTDISRIEASGWIPPAEIRQRLADALQTTPAELFDVSEQIAS